jgi:hypothetical protein
MLMVKMATQPAPPLASVSPGASPGICLVVDRALQFERDQRYPDARTMQGDVRALRAGGVAPYASLRASATDPTVVSARVAPPLAPAAGATLAAVAAPPAQDQGVRAPIAFAQASTGAASTARPPQNGARRTWIAIYLAFVVALLALFVGVVLIRRPVGGAAPRPGAATSGEARGPAPVDPDDPSWRPSAANRLHATPEPKARPRPRSRGDEDD